jgi:hypothetical protein
MAARYIKPPNWRQTGTAGEIGRAQDRIEALSPIRRRST